MKRLLTGIAAVALSLGGLAFAGTVTASAATTVPTISISPNIGLTNNEAVTVTGAGFADSQSGLVAVECLITATSATGCNTGAIVPVTVSATGTFTIQFYVATGTVGTGTCGTTTSDANCAIAIGSTAGVLYAAGEINFSSGPGIAVDPQTNVTGGSSVSLTGVGFPASSSFLAVECLRSATGSAGCDTSTLTTLTSDANGNIAATPFKAVAGTIGTGTCGTSATDYNACVIEVATSTGTELSVALLSFNPSPSSSGGGSTGSVLTVTPATGLTNGQSVTITGTGFTPADSVYAVECLANATGATGCDTATATAITVGADGSLPSTSFKVVAGTIGTGTCGTSASDVSDCIIEVANTSEADTGSAAITFSAPTITTTKPAPKATKVTGAAILGKTTTAVITGTNFVGKPKITGHAGTTITVKAVAKTRITVTFKQTRTARPGVYVLTLKFPSGKKTTVKYTVK